MPFGFSLIQLISLGREFGPIMAPLFPMPDWTNSTATRDWVRQKVLVAAAALAAKSATQLDDEIVSAVAMIEADDTLWDLQWNLIHGIAGGTAEAGDLESAFMAKAEAVGIDPATITLIIQAALGVIQFIKQWRANHNPTPTPVPTPTPGPTKV